MKKIFLFLLLPIFLCCNKDDNENSWFVPSESSKLPPATQTGANTAGCLVNGVAFLPKSTPGGPGVRASYEIGYYFSLSLNQKPNGIYQTVLITHNGIELQEGVTYQLNTTFQEMARSGEFIVNVSSQGSPNYFCTGGFNVGELHISKLDLEQGFISGTFWFDAVNSQGTVVKVTEGRFDHEI